MTGRTRRRNLRRSVDGNGPEGSGTPRGTKGGTRAIQGRPGQVVSFITVVSNVVLLLVLVVRIAVLMFVSFVRITVWMFVLFVRIAVLIVVEIFVFGFTDTKSKLSIGIESSES